MSGADDLDWISLDRYFSGTASPDEAAAIERWAGRDPAHAAELEAARRIWEGAGLVRSRFDVRSAKEKVHVKMAEPAPLRVGPRRTPNFARFSGGRRAWAVAAGLAALAVGTILRRSETARPPAIASILTREYVTQRGQRREFRLPDGTRVMLAPQSRLIVASTYGTRAREIQLEGQAYLHVVHDAQRPFAVRAAGTVIRDLGTKFDVRAYAADPAVRVVVAEGRVALEQQVLMPGQIGQRDSTGRISVRSGVDVDRYLAWTSGRLVFDDTPLAEALPELSRWYNLNFQLADSRLARLPLTNTFKDQLDSETLTVLAMSLGVSVERQGNTITIGRLRQ